MSDHLLLVRHLRWSGDLANCRSTNRLSKKWLLRVFPKVKSCKNSFFLLLCSTCGQKSVCGGPQHAAVVDFPAGGSKSFRINQESPT